MSYVTADYYRNTYKGSIPEDKLDVYLSRAADDVDILTYYRIHGRGGIQNLTLFQQEQIRKSVCVQADFLFEQDSLGIPDGVQSYSINGTSVSFGTGDSGSRESGVIPRKSKAVALLNSTGLRYGGC